MDTTTKRQIGNSTVEVTPFGFGAGHIPRVSVQDGLSTVGAAFEAGTRFFDTAPWYGIGASERRLGLALQGIRDRDDFVVNTKIGRTLVAEPIEKPERETVCWDGSPREVRDRRTGFRVRFEYTHDAIKAQHQDSLQRLGLSRVDTLTIHDLDLGYHNREQLEEHLKQFSKDGGRGSAALEQMRRDGTIGALGMGCNREMKNFDSWDGGAHEDLVERIADMVQLDFMIIAGPYTLLDTSAMNRIHGLCRERNISWIIASPFAGGWLASSEHSYMYGSTPDWVVEKSIAIKDVCRTHSVDIGTAALQFVLANPVVAAAIPGAVSPEEIKQNAERLQVRIPAAFWDELKDRELLAAECPVPA